MPSSPSRKKHSKGITTGSSFLSRIDTTLVQQKQSAGGTDDTTRAGTERSATNASVIVDIEEQLVHNRAKERERSRKQRKKVAHVDPRLYKDGGKKGKEEELHPDNFLDEDILSGGQPPSGSLRQPRMGVSAIQGRNTIRLEVLPLQKGRNKMNVSKEEFLETAQEDGVLLGVSRSDTVSFAPRQLLEIESGNAVLVTTQKFVQHHEFQELQQSSKNKSNNDNFLIVVTSKAVNGPSEEIVADALRLKGTAGAFSKKVASNDVRFIETNREWGVFGGAWRGALRRLMMLSLDTVNGLQFGRQLQLFIPFLAGYESYLVGQIIEALDDAIVAMKSQRGAAKRFHKREVNYVLAIAFRNRNVSRIIVQTIGPRWDFVWHWWHQIKRNRLYDAWGRLPVIGFTSFPATENFPATKNHALASIFRVVLGPGNWITRVLTQNRQGLNSDDPEKNIAQNLAAESNGSEAANRNQFGNFFGRIKANEFRIQNRLPTDESIVRTFITSPMSTLINNGVVHFLRQVSKHWHNMLNQPFGNFAHQRMEQLDPFETMRFHMPQVCVVLSSLRGRNAWDGRVLGPFLRRCQHLTTATYTATECGALAKEMRETMVVELSGGVAMVAEPLSSWLDAIHRACTLVEKEAQEVYKKLSSVEVGLRLGYDLISQVSWKIPYDKELENAIWLHLRDKNPGALVTERRIRNALHMTTPRDKRTLMELIKQGLVNSKPAKLLMGRVRTLLKREIRREYLNEGMRELSTGEIVARGRLKPRDWYWLEEKDEKDRRSVHIFVEKTGNGLFRFRHADTGVDRDFNFDTEAVIIRKYIPVAESIVRAQRCYMNLELDHGHKFSYNAFMEFSFLRTALRRLAIVSQICCEELDNARLTLLKEAQLSNSVSVDPRDLQPGQTYYIYDSGFNVYAPFVCKKRYTSSDPEWKKLQSIKIVRITPQSMIVVGGGPTGLLTVIHCTENVLLSGGQMKLYESRDAFEKGGSAFERAQIVRLDARWIAMLRYHLGTGFEDVFIPASGETDAQLGNTLPSQGFIEITIKDLECILHVAVSRLWSKGVIEVFTDAKAQYDVASNSLAKAGEQLKIGDEILRRVDPDGNPSKEYYRWRVKHLEYIQPLGLDDLRVGEEYVVYVQKENAVLPFKLEEVNLNTRMYIFKALKKKVADLQSPAHNLPSVYPKGTRRHADVSSIIFECTATNKDGKNHLDLFHMNDIREERFTLDVGHTHVVECIGKPHGSKVHFQVTPTEPYGVCCIQGLKISMGMHNFGEKRWRENILDDFRSTNDQNTRIIGDFTKMVRQPRIAEEMEVLMNTENWQIHFTELVEDSKFRSLNEKDPIVPKILEAVKVHAKNATTYRRQTLQTRFFETGDNYYLGMEFTREYDKWKNELTDKLVLPLMQTKKISEEKIKNIASFRGVLMHNIDRLWYEACLEVIRRGDVYNPGARHRVPRIHLINSYIPESLGKLSLGESFRISDRLGEKYEILLKQWKTVIVRNIEGVISKFPNTTEVFREGDLTRSPDGNSESKVAIATFPLAHYVNHRSIRLNNETRGYVFAFLGDEQSTPHFMRYSGLTGSAINAMQFNNFVVSAIEGVPFINRFRIFSQETTWSNGEVVQRGTTTNYGEDGFLRPGFSYDGGIKYIQSKVVEWLETKQDLDNILSHDWKKKFASSMVPRGMEMNAEFIATLKEDTNEIIFDMFVNNVKNDRELSSKDRLAVALVARREAMSKRRGKLDHEQYWSDFVEGLGAVDNASRSRLKENHSLVAKLTEKVVTQIIDFAKQEYLYDMRYSQEFWNQPKPVDSIVDDFAVEAQSFANALALSAAFSAASVAFVLYDLRRDNNTNVAQIIGAVIVGLNILLSFGTMTNIGRYKIRNEEARTLFFDHRFLGVKKAAFRALDKGTRKKIGAQENPFLVDLEAKKQKFVQNVYYYNMEDPEEFLEDYRDLREQVNQPGAIVHFQKLLATYYIAEVYQVNSYIQEDLVKVYKICDEILDALSDESNKARENNMAFHLFNRINDFTPQLESSLQRGHIYWGFLKQRKFLHWDVCIVFRYFLSLFCCSSGHFRIPLSSVENETYGIIKEAKAVYSIRQGTNLKREIRDLEYLYWATRESDIASMIFVSSFLGFIVSWIFSISRIITRLGGPSSVTEVGFWASISSALGAILAAFHFVRKLLILVGLWCTLGGKIRAAGPDKDSRRALGRIKSVTFIQLLLTLARLGAAIGSAVALPWSVAQNAFPDKITTDEEIPLWIALGAFCAAVGATVFFFLVEYIVRYNLPPKLGEFVCEAFREELETTYKVLSIRQNSIDTKQAQERKTWEYVARDFLHRYRFDTVFAADRFGSILQYIQGGCKKKRSKTSKKKQRGEA